MSKSEELFEAFKASYGARYELVEYAFENPYVWPEMDTLRHEICGCIAFGLNQAAMTLINHLVESVLKYSLIYKHSIENEVPPENPFEIVSIMMNYTKSGRNKYGSITLTKSIDSAHDIGLIEEEERNQLHCMRKLFRNPYSHSDKKGIFSESSVPVTGAKVSNDGISFHDQVEVNIAEFPLIQGYAQSMFAEKEALYYFLAVDTLVRSLKEKVFSEKNT
jgi:hypothetical protein